MKIATQRILDRLIGVPLCALLSLVDRLWRRSIPTPPRTIAVILLSEKGSMVCAQPMLLRLRERYPLAVLCALVLASHRGAVEMLGIIPDECIVTIDDRTFWTFLSGSFAALKRLHALRVDTVIDCELFARVSAIYSYLSGATLRVGFHRHTQEGLYRGTFINRPVLYNPYMHIASQFLALAGALDSASVPAGKEQPIAQRPALVPLEFGSGELASAIARLEQTCPALRGRRLVLMYAGTGALPIRGWPLEKFEALGAALIADGCAVALVGLDSDRGVCDRIVKAVGSERCVNLAGYTRTLRDFALLCHRAALLVSNDGGPGHFAALTPVPILSFFGPETPLLYAPLSPRTVSLFRPLPCAPCLSAYNHRRTPCDGDNQCLKQISIEEAFEAARTLLATGGTT